MLGSVKSYPALSSACVSLTSPSLNCCSVRRSIRLSVVVERYEPDLIAIAPVSIKEPPERTEAVAFEIGRTAAEYRIPVLVWQTKQELFGSFPVGADSKGIITQRIEGGVPGSRNRALAWSSITAIAGFERLMMANGAAGLFAV